MNTKTLAKMNAAQVKAKALIDEFCKQPSESDGGYATVADGDVDTLEEIVYEIIEAKYGPDPDGDRPINFEIIDRTKYEPSHYQQVPYSHKAKDDKEKEEILQTLLSNMQIAAARLETFLRIRQYDRRNPK